MAKTLTKYLLFALVLSLAFGQLLRFELPYGVLYPHDLFVVLLLILNFRTRFVTRDFRTRFGIFLGIAVVGLALAIPQLGIRSVALGSLYLWRLTAYFLLFFSLKARKVTIAAEVFLAGGLVQWLIGLAQYSLMPDMRWAKYLGWDDHLNRLILPHFDPTFTGVTLSLFALYVLASQRGYRRLLAGLIAPAILLTYARSVWLSLTLTALVFIKQVKYVLIGLVLFALAIPFLPRSYGEGTNLLRLYSITSRWNTDLAYIKALSPWQLPFGMGMNTLPARTFSSSLYPEHATGPNNSYIYLFVTTGMFGLLAFGNLLLEMYRRSRWPSVWAFLLIASLFNNALFYPFALLWVLMLEQVKDSR